MKKIIIIILIILPVFSFAQYKVTSIQLFEFYTDSTMLPDSSYSYQEKYDVLVAWIDTVTFRSGSEHIALTEDELAPTVDYLKIIFKNKLGLESTDDIFRTVYCDSTLTNGGGLQFVCGVKHRSKDSIINYNTFDSTQIDTFKSFGGKLILLSETKIKPKI